MMNDKPESVATVKGILIGIALGLVIWAVVFIMIKEGLRWFG